MRARALAASVWQAVAVPTFDGVQSHVLVRALDRFRERVAESLVAPLERELRGFQPAVVKELLEELAVIGRQLEVGPVRTAEPNPPWPECSVHEVHARMLKRVIVVERRALAQEIDGPRQKTTHRDAIRWLERELRVLDDLIASEWFGATTPARVPRLTDFMSIRHAEAARPQLGATEPGELDEKFGILQAPRSLLPDLASHRARCELRDLPVALVYLDIDDFKAFNTEYGETRVDRDVLPPFMERLEAVAFARGHAYRIGGDEYAALLPNTDADDALAFARRFAASCRTLRCPGIDRRPTISAGIVVVGPDGFLTEHELLARADRAKAFAKAEGKARAASYTGDRFREDDLCDLGAL
jgi:diguanylate cyclase (GGDEF)-like protein